MRRRLLGGCELQLAAFRRAKPSIPGDHQASPETFDMLRAAVTVARFEQVDKVAVLRAKLIERFPNQDSAIDEALSFWVAYHGQRP